MSHSCEKMTEFHPCNRFVYGKHLPIEGHGNLVVEFPSGQNSVCLKLIHVANVPSLSCHLFSGPACVEQNHTLTLVITEGSRSTSSLASRRYSLWSEPRTSRTVLDLILRQFKLSPLSPLGLCPQNQRLPSFRCRHTPPPVDEVCGATRREAEEGEQATPVCGVFDGKERASVHDSTKLLNVVQIKN